MPLILRHSDKNDGNMSLSWDVDPLGVTARRRAFLRKEGLHLEDCVFMNLEHGERIIHVTKAHAWRKTKDATTAEALITTEKHLALFLMTADCLPIALYDPAREVLALCHLGWMPTDKQLIQSVVHALQRDFDSQPGDLLALIGPGIHKESYIHALPLKQHSTALDPYISILSSGKEVAIDLVAANIAQLITSGVQAENIDTSPIDTATSSKHFSHYRSVRTGELEGRFATIAFMS